MVNGIDKKALFRLKAEPYLKPISDLGVGFYNLDENTAKIEFQLYNSKGTLQISEINIDAYACFESANGSASDVIDLEVLDGLNGIVGITLDKEFLQASTDTKVKGQVYVGVNNVDNNPENNEVAVFREFTFEVADALINKISSFTKIEYIRMFDQLKARILQRVNDIEQAIANGADYVAEMKTVKEQGIAQINQTVTEGKAYIDSVIAQAQTNINDTGWIPYQLINGALSNTAYKGFTGNGFDCAYRTITNGSIVTKKLRINGSNLTPGQVIAQLPVNFAKNTQVYPVSVPGSNESAYIVIRPNGEVSFNLSNSDDSWNEERYAYAELTWHD